MNKITYTAISIFMFSLAWGMDIELTDGTILREVTVAEVNFRGIELIHREGGESVLPKMIAGSDQSKLKEHIARYKQLVGNKKISDAIQKARRSGSINAAIPILELAIRNEPEAANIAEARKYLTLLKKKSKSDVTVALITAANEKDLSTAIEIMEKAVAENSFAENLEQAKNKLAELKKRNVGTAANDKVSNSKSSSKYNMAAERAAKGRQRIMREQQASMQRRQNAAFASGWERNETDRSSNTKDRLTSLNRNFAAGSTANGWRRQNTVSSGLGRNETDRSDPRPVHVRIAEGPLTQDSTPYCLRCGGSGQIAQVTMPSEGALINAAFGGQPATAKQIRRTCPTCGGSGKRY